MPARPGSANRGLMQRSKQHLRLGKFSVAQGGRRCQSPRLSFSNFFPSHKDCKTSDRCVNGNWGCHAPGSVRSPLRSIIAVHRGARTGGGSNPLARRMAERIRRWTTRRRSPWKTVQTARHQTGTVYRLLARVRRTQRQNSGALGDVLYPTRRWIPDDHSFATRHTESACEPSTQPCVRRRADDAASGLAWLAARSA